MRVLQNNEKIQKYLKKALAKHHSGNLDQAQFYYEKILKEDSGHIDGNYLLGTLHAERGNYQSALKYLKQAADLSPPSSVILNNLGNVYRFLGDFDSALLNYQLALTYNPSLVEAHINIGFVYRRQGKFNEAAAYYQHASKLDPEQVTAHYYLAQCLEAIGKQDEATDSFRRVLELSPEHSAAQYHLAALTGNTPETAPKEFVLEVFDTHADKFDAYLVDTLGYNVPELLRKAVLDLQGGSANFANALDLGCGTGLSGKVFRDLAQRISGCDLAPRMLAESRKKDIYDELLQGDVAECLNREGAPYDLFISADLFIYIGALDKIFAEISAHATDNALLVFSVERLEGEQDYQLLKTGRYAQSRAYIQRLADTNQFRVASLRSEPFRKEGDTWITGDIYVLARVA